MYELIEVKLECVEGLIRVDRLNACDVSCGQLDSNST